MRKKSLSQAMKEMQELMLERSDEILESIESAEPHIFPILRRRWHYRDTSGATAYPNRLICGLELTYHVAMDDRLEFCALITDDMLKRWDCSKELVDEIARKNYQKKVRIDRVDTMLQMDLPLELFVIRDPHHMFGASVLAYPELLNELLEKAEFRKDKERIEDDRQATMEERAKEEPWYLIPSSVYEILAFPVNSANGSVRTIRQIVRHINAEMVSHKDQLSDQVYLFDPSAVKKGVRIARDV